MKAAHSGKPRGIARPNTSAKVGEIASVHTLHVNQRPDHCAASDKRVFFRGGGLTWASAAAGRLRDIGAGLSSLIPSIHVTQRVTAQLPTFGNITHHRLRDEPLMQC